MATSLLDSLRSLDGRVASLEQQVGASHIRNYIDAHEERRALVAGAKGTTEPESKNQGESAKKVASVQEELKEARTKLNQVLTEDMKTFLEKYERLQYILESSLSFEEVVLDNQLKEQTVLSTEKELNDVLLQLKAVAKLAPLLDRDGKEPIQNLANFMRKLEALQTVCNDQLLEVSAFHSEVEELVGTYNDLVTSLSRTLLYWDSNLKVWEQKVKALS